MSLWRGHERLRSIMTSLDLYAKYGTYRSSITLVSSDIGIKRA